MKMKIAFRMKVTASTPDEEPEAQRINDDIARMHLRRRATFDESLLQDFNRIIADLGQLMNRANARRRRRRK